MHDINGKSTTKVVEALGNEKEIREKHPGVDPKQWTREYAKKLTELENKKMPKSLQNIIPINLLRKINNVHLMSDTNFYRLSIII